MFGHYHCIVPRSNRLLLYAMEKSLSRSKLGANADPVARSHHSDAELCSINCLLRKVRIEGSACLLARVNYCFPCTTAVSAVSVIRHAEGLNNLVEQSRVHVVKDLDGDCGYFLQMDSVLTGDLDRTSVAAFLSDVAKDVAVMLRYLQAKTDSPLAKRLSAISEGFNATSFQTNVCMVA